jgi:dTDP-4-dehydrorhamnose reductase
MPQKVLLFGATGKMGSALSSILDGYILDKRNTSNSDVLDFNNVKSIIETFQPSIVINAVAILAIDPSEISPNISFKSNTLLPKYLAQLSNIYNFMLINFSTDAVFNNEKRDFYIESDKPSPLNIYGMTKYGGDCMIQSISKKFYVIRIPVLFGESCKKCHFVENTLQQVQDGKKELRIANDVVSSPSYSVDVAHKIKEIIENDYEYGVYHVANYGKISLYDLISEILYRLDLDIKIVKASFKDFPHIGKKNTFTPITSEKIKPLRNWREAVKDYCSTLSLN